MAKKLKDLGGNKWEKYSSIKSAQEAGSIYYSKGGKKMAAVLKGDLGKGQSLRSFMNEQLKAPTKRKTKVEPKAGGQVGIAESGNPKVGPGNSGMREPEITVRKLSKTRGGRGDGSYETLRRTIDRSKKPNLKTTPRKTAKDTRPKTEATGVKTNSQKLAAWKAGDKSLSPREQFRLAKWAQRNGIKTPTDLAKGSVVLSLKTSKKQENKMYGTKKKTKGYNKGGSMPMVMKNGKKVPAYAADGVGKMNMGGMAKKKMMGGGMVKYNKGGAAKNKVMTYNMGGMVKSQVNNLKKKK